MTYLNNSRDDSGNGWLRRQFRRQLRNGKIYNLHHYCMILNEQHTWVTLKMIPEMADSGDDSGDNSGIGKPFKPYNLHHYCRILNEPHTWVTLEMIPEMADSGNDSRDNSGIEKPFKPYNLHHYCRILNESHTWVIPTKFCGSGGNPMSHI